MSSMKRLARLRRGPRIHLDNRYLAAWVREHGAWKSVAYQPTPIIDGDIHRALARGRFAPSGPRAVDVCLRKSR